MHKISLFAAAIEYHPVEKNSSIARSELRLVYERDPDAGLH